MESAAPRGLALSLLNCRRCRTLVLVSRDHTRGVLLSPFRLACFARLFAHGLDANSHLGSVGTLARHLRDLGGRFC